MLAASYATKESLKADVDKPLHYVKTRPGFGSEYTDNGEFCVVGPSRESRKWFARVTMKGGLIHKVA